MLWDKVRTLLAAGRPGMQQQDRRREGRAGRRVLRAKVQNWRLIRAQVWAAPRAQGEGARGAGARFGGRRRGRRRNSAGG